jgi:hypothetical protein
MLLLLIGGRHAEAREWLGNLVGRLAHSARAPKHWPLTAPFEDALLIKHGFEEVSPEFRSTSTLLPILLMWASVLGMKDVYEYARTAILPELKDITPNCWSSDAGYDGFVADPAALFAHGVGEGVMHLPDEPAAFLSTMATALPGVAPIEESAWYGLRAAYIPLLAALHWRLQMPREMLVRQSEAVASSS